MSAGCLRCAASDFAETVSLTYGFVLEDVRWQIDFLAAVPARAVVSAVPASASTAIKKANRFMFLPPKVEMKVTPSTLSRRRADSVATSSETRGSLIGGSEVRGRGGRGGGAPPRGGGEPPRRILAEHPVPIVMLTAYGYGELISRAVEAGVAGFVVKPFEENALLAALRTASVRGRDAAGLTYL